MPTIGEVYKQTLDEAQRRTLTLSRAAVLAIQSRLRAAADEFTALEGSGAITADQAVTLGRQARALLATWGALVGTATGLAVWGVWSETVTLHRDVNAELFQSHLGEVPDDLPAKFDALLSQARQEVASRTAATDTARGFMAPHVDAAGVSLDTLLAAAVAAGLGVSLAARHIADLIGGRVPAALRAIGINFSDMQGLTSLESDASRIAVSQTLSALRESNAAAMTVSPIVSAAFWQVSERHDFLASSPDECDVLALTDFYDLGPGWHPVNRWPKGPHPHCGCRQGKIQWRLPLEWGQPKPQSPHKRVTIGDLGLSEDWSDLRVARARRTLRQAMRL